jgi:hypothetical protein
VQRWRGRRKIGAHREPRVDAHGDPIVSLLVLLRPAQALAHLYAALINHGGEAVACEAQFEALPDRDQLAIVSFLKTCRCQGCR